jgi:hypothetical protein
MTETFKRKGPKAGPQVGEVVTRAVRQSTALATHSAAHDLLGRGHRIDETLTAENALGVLHQRRGGTRKLDAVVVKTPQRAMATSSIENSRPAGTSAW